MILNVYLVRKYSYAPAQRRRTTMVLDGQRMSDERDWVLVGFFVTCSSSAEKRFIRPAKQDEMGLWARKKATDGIFPHFASHAQKIHQRRTRTSIRHLPTSHYHTPYSQPCSPQPRYRPGPFLRRASSAMPPPRSSQPSAQR